jgi:hypothetical protein
MLIGSFATNKQLFLKNSSSSSSSIPAAPTWKLRAYVKRFVSLQCFNLSQSVGLLGRGISPSQGHYLPQTQNKYRQTSMPWGGFEPTISVFERAKTFHASDRAATVIGNNSTEVFWNTNWHLIRMNCALSLYADTSVSQTRVCLSCAYDL